MNIIFRRTLLIIGGMLLFLGETHGNISPKNFMPPALPHDSAVVTGRLSNGLTYYIRHNDAEPGKADFYLIRNAGAILEDNGQEGIAHFLEHMAFQGTKHFPGNSILTTLERHGLTFGRDLNAITDLNETIFRISNVPVTSPAITDTCLLILHDWSHYLTIDAKEVEDEKKIIAEEWRSKQTGDFRIMQQIRPVLYQGSRYASRDVIGPLNNIRNFTHADLRKFYNEWYRTDLEAVVVVGDIDVKSTESKIKTLFASIPMPANARRRTFTAIPEHQATYYVQAHDREISQPEMNLSIILKDTPDSTKNSISYLKDKLTVTLFNRLAGNRIKEIAQQTDAPFFKAGIRNSDLVRGYRVYTISVTPKPGKEAQAWQTIITENERIRRYGFTDSEQAQAKRGVLEAMGTNSLQHRVAANQSHISNIEAHFLTGEPLLTLDAYTALAQQLIPEITSAEVSEKARLWNTKNNRTIIVTSADNDTNALSETQAKAILDRAETDPSLQPYRRQTSAPTSLLDEEPVGCKIKEEKPVPQFQAVRWELENGATVIYKQVPREGKVLISSYSKGGTDLFAKDLIPAAENAASMVSSFGLGQLSPTQLNRIMSGKKVSCRVEINEHNTSVGGAAAATDAETLFQLLYLRFAKPRFDETMFRSTIDTNYRLLEQMAGNPQNIMQDAYKRIMADDSTRVFDFSKSYLDHITLDRLRHVYETLLGNAADFTFFVVGDIGEARAKHLVETYIGAIPPGLRKEKPLTAAVKQRKGKTTHRIHIPMETPRAAVVVRFLKSASHTAEHNLLHAVLQHIMQERYTRSIREKAGGTYAVTVSGTAEQIPEARYSVLVQFDCDPKEADRLMTVVYEEADKIKRQAPTAEEVGKAIAAIRQDNGAPQNTANYWIRRISTLYIDGTDNGNPDNFDHILDRISPKDVHRFAKDFYGKANITELTFTTEPD